MKTGITTKPLSSITIRFTGDTGKPIMRARPASGWGFVIISGMISRVPSPSGKA